MTMSAPVPAMAEQLLCVPLLIADRPRSIDTVIDYFGDPPRTSEANRPRAVHVAERW